MASRRLAAVVAATTLAALAAPALADTASVPVTVVGLGGTRQFAVEDVSGAALTAIDLGTGSAQPFRTHVTDASFLPTASGGNYDVTATLSNLYLKKTSGTTASDYNYNVKVPSSDLKIGFGSDPLGVTGLQVVDLPKLTLSGSLKSCLSLTAGPDGVLGGLLGLSPLGAVLGSNTALSNLCSTLGALGTATPLTAVVDGALQQVTSAVTDLTKLPTALSGAAGGTFSTPDYANGVGAYDTVGATAAAAANAVPTSVRLMKGTTAGALSSTFATDLLTQLTSTVASTITSNGLTSATGTGTETQLASVISQLQASATPVLSQLGAVLNTLSSSAQTQVINTIFKTVTPVVPVLADLHGVSGSSYAFPVLSATPTTPVAGTYGGTLTVTFVQS